MDDKYLEEVIAYTKNFENPLILSELLKADGHHCSKIKFSSIDYAIKYRNFIETFNDFMKFRNNITEKEAINRFLKSKELTEEEKYILEERIKVINQRNMIER